MSASHKQHYRCHLSLHREHCYSVSEHDRPLIDVPANASMTFIGTAQKLRSRTMDQEQAGMTGLLDLPRGPDISGKLTRIATALN